MVATHCTLLRSLNVALTKIGNKAIQLFANKCKALEELALGCPYRIRDDILKDLVYNQFKNLKKVSFSPRRLS